MDTPKFKNKDGSLTAYAFACGYIEKFEKNDIHLTLEKNGCWHVKAFNFKTHERLFWECPETLTEARKFYKRKKSFLMKNGTLLKKIL